MTNQPMRVQDQIAAKLTRAFAPTGLDVVDWLMLACFAVTLPWSAIGFWNAVIGFALMRLARDPTALAAPVVGLRVSPPGRPPRPAPARPGPVAARWVRWASC